MIINSFVTEKRHVIFADNKSGYYVSNGEKRFNFDNHNRAERQFQLLIKEIVEKQEL